MTGSSDQERREEIEAHLALRAEHDGTTLEEARRRFGNPLQVQEEMRRVYIARWLESLLQDLRFTVRSLLRAPGFALAALAALTPGLGAATAVFSAVDRILFRALPYAEPDRLVSVGLAAPIEPTEFLLHTDYVTLWRHADLPFKSVTTTATPAYDCDLTEARPRRLSCAQVEWNFLRTLGLDAGHVVTASVVLSRYKYPNPAAQSAFDDDLLSRVRRLPGVTAAAWSDSVPPFGMARSMIYTMIEVQGRERAREGTGGMVTWRAVTPGYFEALRIPIVRGRPFTEEDRRAPDAPMILSESLARRLFGTADPRGQLIRAGGATTPWHPVVGVAKDVRNAGLAVKQDPEYYLVRRNAPEPGLRGSSLIVRTANSPAVMRERTRIGRDQASSA
jgi:hypothetical protein